MSDSNEDRSPASPNSRASDDERLADVLDQYVDALHADDVGTRTQSLQGHPELRDLMGCLDSLEILAPPHDLEAHAEDERPAWTPDAPTISTVPPAPSGGD
ncbi:MAG: hypothetical protein ACE5KM_11785, partial [Planctomycetaceae bacterium]